VKIIERREPEDVRVGTFRCWFCKSLFATEHADIPNMTHTDNSRWDNDPREPSEYWSIGCPVCGRSVQLLFPEGDD